MTEYENEFIHQHRNNIVYEWSIDETLTAFSAWLANQPGGVEYVASLRKQAVDAEVKALDAEFGPSAVEYKTKVTEPGWYFHCPDGCDPEELDNWHIEYVYSCTDGFGLYFGPIAGPPCKEDGK